MRFAILVKASKDCEAGIEPNAQFMNEMRKFNDELAKAGVLVALERLKPSSRGTRVQFSGSERTAIDGPFAETKELIGGFWIWNCKSREEAVEWVKRCPTHPTGSGQIEIREILEADDIGGAFALDSSEKEDRVRPEAVA